MPKILDNPEERLLLEARKQIKELGYAATTIRSVASACGIAVGTVHNYFPSKEAMVATYTASDWKICLETISAATVSAHTPEPLLRCIFDEPSASLNCTVPFSEMKLLPPASAVLSAAITP